MPKKEVVKNDNFTFKFTTSNKTNNFNKNYSKNVIEQINLDQIAKNNKNIVKKSENLIKNSPSISLESKNKIESPVQNFPNKKILYQEKSKILQNDTCLDCNKENNLSKAEVLEK